MSRERTPRRGGGHASVTVVTLYAPMDDALLPRRAGADRPARRACARCARLRHLDVREQPAHGAAGVAGRAARARVALDRREPAARHPARGDRAHAPAPALRPRARAGARCPTRSATSTELRVLDLGHNRLTGLPPELRPPRRGWRSSTSPTTGSPSCPSRSAALRALRYLGATDNGLAAVPDWIGELDRLVELRLYRNALHRAAGDDRRPARAARAAPAATTASRRCRRRSATCASCATWTCAPTRSTELPGVARRAGAPARPRPAREPAARPPRRASATSRRSRSSTCAGTASSTRRRRRSGSGSAAAWCSRSLRGVGERAIRSWLMDMDGVLVHEEAAIPGAPEFIARLRERGAAVPRPHQQLDLHAPRPRGAAAHQRARRAGGGDLDVGARDRRLPRGPAAGRLGVRDRRGRADDRAARGRLHADRARPRLRRARRDPHVLDREPDPRDPADRRRRALHRHQPRPDRRRRRRARRPRPARSPR